MSGVELHQGTKPGFEVAGTRTTLRWDDTHTLIWAPKARLSDIRGPNTRHICYATQNRQSAVRDLGRLVDAILMVGATNSSNSSPLREIGTEVGIPSYLLAGGSDLNAAWLKIAGTVGVAAGASMPEVLFDNVIDTLRRMGPVSASMLRGREENLEFGLPAELATV